MPKLRASTRLTSAIALDAAIATLARRCVRLTRPLVGAKAKRSEGWKLEIEATAAMVATLSEAFAHVSNTAGGETADAIGYGLETSDSDDDDVDHGQHVETDHESDDCEMRGARRAIGFRMKRT